MNKGLKVGIVLEGGVAEEAYQTGVLRVLNELGLQYDCVVSTLGGTEFSFVSPVIESLKRQKHFHCK